MTMESDKQPKKRKFSKKKEKFDHKQKFGNKEKTWERENQEIDRLQQKYSEITPNSINCFKDLPLCNKTQRGLQEAQYVKPTEIQRESIGLALQGKDILGAAKTGSGKTLAFLIPILEGLYRHKWNRMDGMGALVITPTRELAYQIFEVLRKIGKYHDFSAGLVIGGKHVREEAERIHNTNIVICTPGRLLQHMDETAYFHADNLQYLVLDEADRILDLGFAQSMNAIIENLPKKRQTLLFSATQTKSVKDLARLSLTSPMYVSVHENAKHSTPSKLTQSYVVCELHEKLDLLWSFIKSHLKSKILVFMSSCKQVRFVYETFRQLRPGVTLLALHGAMQQLKRVDVYDKFCRKEHCIMFATDIAARGLDFPAVSWVIQLDCPEDANTYIHRAGRTARYETDGEALLVLLPSEEQGMVKQLEDKKIPIEKIKVNPKKTWSIQNKMMSQCAADVQMKEFAQRAFQSYLKSVFFMSNKEVFDVTKLDTEQYARSLGLAIAPRVRFLQKESKRQQALLIKQQEQEAAKRKAQTKDNNKSNKSDSDSSESESSDESDTEIIEKLKNKLQTKTTKLKLKSQSNNSNNSSSSSDEDDESSDDDESEDNSKHKVNEDVKFDFLADDDNDDLLTLKKKDDSGIDDEDEDDEPLEHLDSKKQEKTKKSKASVAKKVLKKKLVVNSKIVFNDEGEAVVDVHKKQQNVLDEDDYEGGIKLDKAMQRMKEEDQFDKELYREKVKKKHREKRIKERKERQLRAMGKKPGAFDDEDEAEVMLPSGEEDGPNIDDLPDPDEIYGKRGNSESDMDQDTYDNKGMSDESESEKSYEESSSEESEEELPEPPKKKSKSSQGKKKNLKQSQDEEDFATGDLITDEALALKLLGT